MTDMTFGERLAAGREAIGWSQQDMAEALKSSQGTISRYELNKRVPDYDRIREISDVSGLSVAYLMGLSDDPFSEPTRGPVHMRPVLGRIAAGTPREALEQSDERHAVSDDVYRDHPHGFWLQVAGNSMNRLFPDGALIYVDMDAELRNGDVAVVNVNGYDATVKRIYWEPGAIRLKPDSWDMDYQDRVIYANDPDAPAVRTVGKVITYTAPDGWRA